MAYIMSEPKVHRMFGSRDDLLKPREPIIYADPTWAQVEEYVDSARANELWFLYQQGRIRNLTLHEDGMGKFVTYDTPA